MDKMFFETHNYFMQQAIELALEAKKINEVPVAALVVHNNQIIAASHNLVQKKHQAIYHAELLAIKTACKILQSKYLNTCTLYVTLEPCVMCAAALKLTHLKTLVYGAADLKAGFMTLSSSLLHPKTNIVSGVLAVTCGELLTSFFEERRQQQ